MKLQFFLRFSTTYGQALFISGNHPALGAGTPEGRVPLQYVNNDFWQLTINTDLTGEAINYQYQFQNEFGETNFDAEKSRLISAKELELDSLTIVDSWNDESFFENAFYTAPFNQVFFADAKKAKAKKDSFATHSFRVKAPLLAPDEAVCLLGNSAVLGSWDRTAPLVMQKKGDWWTLDLDGSGNTETLVYKYGVVNTATKEFLGFESGDNRTVFGPATSAEKVILHDGFVRLPNTNWKGAGVAIPVFSLRTANSFGIGEFADIKNLADWAKEVGLKLIQLLPINDTSATFTWRDSYPYAAISAFALHPVYISLSKVAGKKYASSIKSIQKKQKQLNALHEVDYDSVIRFKMDMLRELYDMDGGDFMSEAEYKEFFAENSNWLKSYAAFCYFRDRNNTADFSTWKTGSVYNEEEVARLTSSRSMAFKHIAFHYFVQYHLHKQLKEAVEYAHKKGLVLKGDIPIGIYRNGADAWTAPHLYNMDKQAGAPPDDFAVKGQNWGFPTYNWQQMEADNYEWWRQRFRQMSNYFDAFRIDHILGFFRIWSIPMHSVEGIMGRFVPALPVSVYEFGERGLWFDYDRLCKPFIIDAILYSLFDGATQQVKESYLQPDNRGGYELREAFNTQQKVAAHFANEEPSDEGARIKQGLFDLISNVILFEEEGSEGQLFHFRISVESTTSFQYLDENTKWRLKELYVDYFYRRQDGFWKGEALKKLPALKKATNMLICGEDLGMVPHSVPEVMKSLGILSLEVQRMPKDPTTEFFHPANAPYLSVVTPSTHDMSTVRGWWEEDRTKTQNFYNQIMGDGGTAPYFCEAWVNRAIVLQHLYSPAMWSIFQLQDILGMSETLRRQNPHEERINEPSNPTHYWRYRMHIPLEQLCKEKEFNEELKDYITNSGRGK